MDMSNRLYTGPLNGVWVIVKEFVGWVEVIIQLALCTNELLYNRMLSQALLRRSNQMSIEITQDTCT